MLMVSKVRLREQHERKPTMRTPEAWEKAEIDKYLKSIGAYVVKPITMGYGASGAPDRICCIDGLFVAIEVKREGKGPTALQRKRLTEVLDAGGAGFWGTAAKVIAEFETWRT